MTIPTDPVQAIDWLLGPNAADDRAHPASPFTRAVLVKAREALTRAAPKAELQTTAWGCRYQADGMCNKCGRDHAVKAEPVADRMCLTCRQPASLHRGFTCPPYEEAAPPARDASSVPMPQNADQAAAMASIGIAWLRDNAPERLKPEARDAEDTGWRPGQDLTALRAKYASAVRTLQDIAKTPYSWEKRPLILAARDTLIQLGEPIEPEGM